MTVRESVDSGVRRLVAAGFSPDEARRDAGVFSRAILGWSLTEWATGQDRQPPDSFGHRLGAMVSRRLQREPVAYITGVREFYGRSFHVTPDVLIPRPETEAIVEIALALVGSLGSLGSSGPVVVDVGTGSGCLAITMALEFPAARVFATDLSRAALDVAARNARELGAAVEFSLVGADAFLPAGTPPIDLIVSNPPYVPARDRDSLPPDVRHFEPAAALFGGDDGLEVIRALLPVAARALAPDGTLLMEIGAGQAERIEELVRAAPLEFVRFQADLQGIPRVLVARRTSV